MSAITRAATVADVNWNHMGDMGDWSVLGWLFMLTFWLLVVLGIFWLVRELVGSRHRAETGPDEILERRFAAGEIGVEEYRERSAALKGTPHSP